MTPVPLSASDARVAVRQERVVLRADRDDRDEGTLLLRDVRVRVD